MTQNPAYFYEASAFDFNSWIIPQTLPQGSIPPDGQGVTKGGLPPLPPQSPGGGHSPQRVNSFGAIPVYTVANTSSGGLVPYAGLTSVLKQGALPVPIVIGPCNGGLVVNPTTTAGQGIGSTEVLNLDLVNQPQAGDTAANGTTFQLSSTAGSNTFTIPALAPGVILWAVATTAGHKISVTVW